MGPSLDEVRRLVTSDPYLGQKDLDHDPVAMVCGRDRKGYVRGLGKGVSKTAIRASAPCREIARKERQHNEKMKNEMDSIKKANEELSRTQKVLQEEVVALKEMMQSTPRSSHQSFESGSTSQGIGSPSDLSTKCCLLRNLKKKVIALGRVNSDVTPAVETYNIIIDAIYDYDEYLCDRELKFGDIMVGDLVNWPKAFVEFIR